MRLPSTNPVTLPYGDTTPPYYSVASPHAGTDYAGSDLNSYAPEQVTITAFYPYDGVNPCGNQLDMKSIDGQRTYRFCHSSEIYAQAGKTYPEGAILAKEGQVGLAYGVHLHFVMWVNGNRVDGDATIKSMIGDNMPSLANETDVKRLLLAYYTPEQVAASGGDAYVQGFVGTELSALIQAFADSPQFLQKRQAEEAKPVPIPTVVINDVPYVPKG